MAELAFVGLGLGDERGLSARAWEVLHAADEVFAEEYTAVAPDGTLERVGVELHRRIQRLDRAELESERPILDALARSARVALIVVGDPFAATTHVALRLAVERGGHDWKYVPNTSILTAAAGFLGFMHYRFGRTVSFPFPAPGFAPRSPVEQIAGNRERGLHTLVLLDLQPADGRFLTANAALALLRERDPEGVVVPPNTDVGVAARVGRDDAAGWFGPLEELVHQEFGPPMHVVVIPAPGLHFEEIAALARYQRARSKPVE
ncbi:MAG: diphthine synthase [Thermoplasmata archaeon]|jgi:diphthine synthase|nr:diphthine synthase [Thermoplasmata archaeon]